MVERANVLIISLGRSPAIVPETIDALSNQGIKVDRTYIITTNDEKIQKKCIPLIQADFNKNYKDIELFPYECMIENKDIETREDHIELIRKAVYNIFKKETKKRSNIYISIAGGRKTMSAAMALLAQFFNVRALIHILVPLEIERKGDLYALNQIYQEIIKKDKIKKIFEEIVSLDEIYNLLHPKNTKLIFFPIIGISRMLPIITDIYLSHIDSKKKKKKKSHIDSKEYKEEIEILKENKLIDEENEPTNLFKDFFQLINEIQIIPEAYFEKADIVYTAKEISNAPKGYNRFMDKLAKHDYIRKVIGYAFEKKSKTKGEGIANNDIDILVQYSDGDNALKIRLETTAKTRGQAEVIKNSIHNLIEEYLGIKKKSKKKAKKNDKNVLLISLGFSPAIVPETIDALKKEIEINIDKVYLLTTSNNTIVNEVIPLIENYFSFNYQQEGIELIADNMCRIRNSDIENAEDNLEFMKLTSTILKRESDAGNNIYMSLAGGRKTMSAAMALLAQMYSVRALTHVLVPPEIERSGIIFNLRELLGYTEENIPPPKQIKTMELRDEINNLFRSNQTTLILFPIIGLSWMLPDMINYLEGNTEKMNKPLVESILAENGLLDNDLNLTTLGEELLDLLNVLDL